MTPALLQQAGPFEPEVPWMLGWLAGTPRVDSMVGYDTKNGTLFAGDGNFATESTPLDLGHCILRCDLQPVWSCTSNSKAQHFRKLLASVCRDPNLRPLRIAYPQTRDRHLIPSDASSTRARSFSQRPNPQPHDTQE